MAAIRLEEPNDCCCFYKMGTFRGTSVSFLTFVIDMVRTGFMKPNDIVVLDNARIHSTDYCEHLSQVLWEVIGVLVVFLPAYSPELNPIELCFNYFSQILERTSLRSTEEHSDELFLYLCTVVLNRINKRDILQMYRKVGFVCN